MIFVSKQNGEAMEPEDIERVKNILKACYAFMCPYLEVNGVAPDAEN